MGSIDLFQTVWETEYGLYNDYGWGLDIFCTSRGSKRPEFVMSQKSADSETQHQ